MAPMHLFSQSLISDKINYKVGLNMSRQGQPNPSGLKWSWEKYSGLLLLLVTW
jgi:hypothetical protein